MNVSLATQEPKNEESDISTDNPANDDEFSHEGEQESKVILDFNCNIKENKESQLDKYKEVIVQKVKKTSTIPQELTRSDKILKLNKQINERDVEKSILKNSPKSVASSRLHGVAIDEDSSTIIAAGHTMPSSSLQITSIDGFFNRKRGRPPKNRFVEVYKNTFQKPQAIFTSFKLENKQTSVEVSRGCDSDVDHTIEYSRQKPTKECSTNSKRLNRLSTVLATPGYGSCNRFKDHQNRSCDENPTISKTFIEDNNSNYFNSNKGYEVSLDDPINTTQNKFSENHDIGNKKKPISFDSGPEHKKSKLSNVTVVRAAGTFYPENFNSKKCINNTKNSADTVKEEQSIFAREIEVAQNLILENATQINATDCLRVSTTPSNPECAVSVLPQIYNILQMEQQLFAFYQHIALMTPAFSYLDLKTFLASTFGYTNLMTATSSPSSSTIPANVSEMNLLHNKHLMNIILNLQKQQQSNQISGIELASGTRGESRVRQLHRKATTTEDNKRSQNTVTPLDVSAEVHFTADQKVPKSQFQYGRECTPTGYLRYRFNEDCGYEKCGYRQHQSHFHCNRADCHYNFCDRTRFVQHTARHERLDTLMGSDFQQYRVTMACNYTNCPYSFQAAEDDLTDILNNRKSSHFHCLRCTFVCADTNKVVAHRRLHSKMEFIRLAGFRKVTGHENCMISNKPSDLNKEQQNKNNVRSPDSLSGVTLQQFDATCNHQQTLDTVPHCPYVMRHVHYHCLVCNCSVLSKSQLVSHKHRNSLVSHSTSEPLQIVKLSPENKVYEETATKTSI